MIIGLFQKTPNRVEGAEGLGHTFLTKILEFLAYSLYPWKFWTK